MRRAARAARARRQQPLRRDVEQVELAGAQRALDGACLCQSAWSSGTPRARRASFSAATWSCISAISGDTTTPMPVAQQRRDLVAQRLAAAGRHQHERIAAAGDVRRRVDDVGLLPAGRSYPGGEPAFVRTMNAKARALGMSQARFVDPTGLSSRNVATPLDLAKLVSAASRSPTIRDFSTTRSQTVKVGRQLLTYQNTNPLVRDPKWEIAVQKTGYISEAGQCLVLQAEIGGRPVVMVLLNSWGKYTRVADARRLRDWLGARPAMKASARPAKAAAST
jgi:hypothetical protein